MSFLDPEDRALVLSVVYDGPPEAGKTTSVRALARAFGREVETPAQHEGRTVLFDLLEHRAGVYDGAPIHLRIVSVPGQERWAARRAHFVSRADVIVFVGDTTRDGLEGTLAHLDRLRRDLEERDGPPVGVVFQANKRDRPDAVPIDDVAARVASDRVAIFETSASDGAGVREVLVFAVKLALDRVRADAPLEVALSDDPRLAGSAELEALLRGVEASELDASRPSAPPGSPSTPPLRVPRSRNEVSDGFVWPPVEGRLLLAEATRSGIDLRVSGRGDRVIGLGADWRLHSADSAVFPTMDDGRGALLTWARIHSKARDLLSARRCIVLYETEDGEWRLWQIVHREATLRDLDRAEPLDVVRALRHLVAARAACLRAEVELPCSLDTVGVRTDGRIHYVGPVPLSSKPEHDGHAALEELTTDLAAIADTEDPHVLGAAVAELLEAVEASAESDDVRRLFERELQRYLAPAAPRKT